MGGAWATANVAGKKTPARSSNGRTERFPSIIARVPPRGVGLQHSEGGSGLLYQFHPGEAIDGDASDGPL